MIYLCIPTYNEEQTVGVVLWKIRQVMAELERDYQILVADDASTDDTPGVLEPYARVLPLSVLRNAERRGYAASLEMLLRQVANRSSYPRRDVVIPLQADFTEEPEHVATLVKRIESGADIVASNSLPPRTARRLTRWRRPLLNSLLRRLSWPDDVRDPLNGFNAYRVVCLRRALDERKGARLLRVEGWAANAQLLHQALPHARRIDVVDMQPHAERLQRDTRFLFMPALRQVLAVRSGRDAQDLLPPTELRPASIMGGPSRQKDVVAESLHDGGAKPSRRQAEPRRTRNGPKRNDRTEVKPRRKRDAREKVNAAPTPVANGPAIEGSAAASQQRRPRRTRRGSGRARSASQRPAANGESAASSPEPAIASTQATNGPATPDAMRSDAADTAERPLARRRRSNRRGGRGRRRGGDGRARPDEPVSEAAAVSDMTPVTEPTTTPGAS